MERFPEVNIYEILQSCKRVGIKPKTIKLVNGFPTAVFINHGITGKIGIVAYMFDTDDQSLRPISSESKITTFL